ncbi:GNAT family N-acetyltransferase [Lentzea tibetensis]|uniref:GNAT family N-acetyltransferase n=1 Tax=Lentzea tibetensis TaxID=2591470 RepID=A0A563EY02_9PSEU|nr:GNAT family N-acetyltransferase [Lentzea tibetensis]TWP52432.1 GNAT family N-acetyltransferase [Lentzea tibetensis]
MTDLVIRPASADEFSSLPDPGLVGFALRGPFDPSDYRPEWLWVAVRDGTVVARAAWWAGPDNDEPQALDWFDFTDHDAAVRLLKAAPWRPEFQFLLPVDWRERPDALAAANARIEAATAAGYTPLVERYRYTWTAECGLPERPDRLVYRTGPSDDEVLDAFRRVHVGTLDAHARRTFEESGPDAAARESIDYLEWMPSPREWWRLAYTPSGDLVGLTMPCHHYSSAVIGYIGVVPEQRGHGYAYDLLAEATHVLAELGHERIVGATDVSNVPMARNFARAGYPVSYRRLDLT